MIYLRGEFECSLDKQGRFLLPKGIKVQIPSENYNKFILNKGFEKYLTLYPYPNWQIIESQLYNLNTYVKKNVDFIRYIMSGIREVELDNTDRILIPKVLADYAELKKDIVVIGVLDRIEIWDYNKYQDFQSSKPVDMSRFAEEVMGNIEKDNNK